MRCKQNKYYLMRNRNGLMDYYGGIEHKFGLQTGNIIWVISYVYAAECISEQAALNEYRKNKKLFLSSNIYIKKVIIEHSITSIDEVIKKYQGT